MGATTSSIVSEIYLQYVEHTNVVDTLNQHKKLGYFHYVGDFLIVYDNTDTDIPNVIQRFSSINRTLIFSKQGETDNSLNFLDVTLRRRRSNFTVTIFRKPTKTDFIICNTSCHSSSQKLASNQILLQQITYLPSGRRRKRNTHNKTDCGK